AAVAASLAAGDLLDRYTVLDHLGTGGMGQVYAAYDPRLDRKIALKVLRPFKGADRTERRRRLLREARALAQLNDPNVLTLYDVKTVGERVFLAMEYVPGTHLAAWLAAEPRTLRQRLEVFRQAGEGLGAAHRAGLVHRDFKLGNVMVRPDGRALVVDFGLARREASELAEAGADAVGPASEEVGDGGQTAAEAQLTVAGSLLGTPMFMAPELWRGEPAGPASDQFAFCVALYIALYDRAPFERPAGHGPPSSWDVAPAPASSGEAVPAWIRRAVLRGLAVDPEERFASMGQLLEALRRDPGVRRRRWAAASLAVGALATFGLWQSTVREEPCSSGGDLIRAAWNPALAGQLSTAWLGTGEAYADDVARAAAERLDSYAEDWGEMYRDSCLATHVRGEQSAELLDRRTACLDQRRRGVEAIVKSMIDRPEETVEGAVSMIEALPDLASCADTAALLSVVAPPSDPAERQEIDALRSRLADTEALRLAGRFQEAEEQAVDTLADAEGRGYLPVVAEVLLSLGRLQGQTGSAGDAMVTLQRALQVAQVSGHSRPAAEAFVHLVRIAGFELGELSEAGRFGELAEVMVTSLGRGQGLEATLSDHLGMLALQQGEYQEAGLRHRRALDLRRELGQGGGPLEAATLLRLGQVHLEEGKLAEAETRFREALDIQVSALGPNHPAVASTLDRLGATAHRQGRLDEARDLYRRALPILEKVFGAGHLRYASTSANLANVLSSLGDPRAALDHYSDVLDIYVSEHGEQHPWVGITWINISAVRNQLNDFAGASEAAELAAAVVEASYGAEHPLLAQALSAQGEALNELGRFAAAESLHRRALEIQRSAYDEDHPLLGHTLISLGRAQLGQGRREVARRRIEEALELWPEAETDPVHLAWARWMLARSLEGSDPRRAVEAATLARDGFSAASGDHSETLAEILTWLDGRPGAQTSSP
ncbi:MAG: serine/threonine-protein kinase, partial [Acidobacteriota bacterium]